MSVLIIKLIRLLLSLSRVFLPTSTAFPLLLLLLLLLFVLFVFFGFFFDFDELLEGSNVLLQSLSLALLFFFGFSLHLLSELHLPTLVFINQSILLLLLYLFDPLVNLGQFLERIVMGGLALLFALGLVELLQHQQVVLVKLPEVAPALAVRAGGLVQPFLPLDFLDLLLVQAFILRVVVVIVSVFFVFQLFRLEVLPWDLVLPHMVNQDVPAAQLNSIQVVYCKHCGLLVLVGQEGKALASACFLVSDKPAIHYFPVLGKDND